MKSVCEQTLEDMPVTSYSRQATTSNNTGTWKYVRPVYEDSLPPCSAACPAGNDISQALLLAAAGDFAQAARIWRVGNPLPSTLGRVCPHPCEGRCNRQARGGSLSIHGIERFLGDFAWNADLIGPVRCSGKRIAIVGAGPAGITAGYHLSLQGHSVEVYDDKPEPGGYLRTGIPAYRLPKDILNREIEMVARCGVRFVPSTRIGRDLDFSQLRQRYNAVILAVGRHKPRLLDVPGADHQAVLSGTVLLERILRGERPRIPAAVAVVGGGNTALDVARSVLRCGSKPCILYRRARPEMPAIPAEIDEAEREGIEMHFLAAPVRIVTSGNSITGLECRKMRSGAPDSSGRPTPVPLPGSEFLIRVGGVIAAVGETADLDFVPDLGDGILNGTDGAVTSAGSPVFFAGDVVTGAGTVAAAVGSGRRVAVDVDRYLQTGRLGDSIEMLAQLWPRALNLEKIATPDRLNPAYIKPHEHAELRRLSVAHSLGSFAEVVQGLRPEEAVREAQGCLSCGTCNGCMNCYHFCPDIAVRRSERGKGLEISAEHCKGCGICVEECPRGAMKLEPVAS